ncbi:hypothetical protein MKD41_14285 [Lutibacter sp. A64]|uniref:hypothetical protein n=1 Tax=Lutibacter sp. A64 TaxID=2918526 RepID=UPI001F064F60|nr:hypothetical protein [Lutibacter sp. A64]UMB53492.1 hypothetical protein MKD41_14285 [Lutibacter sp. A64]
MNQYKNASFLDLTIRFGAGFLVLFSIVKIGLKIFRAGGFNEMIAAYFGPDNWYIFVGQILLGSLFYGLFMAGYYKFIKK